MKNSHRIVPIALALLLATSAQAQPSDPPAPGRRSQVVSAARKGSPFLSTTRQSYRVVAGLRAVVAGREVARDRMARLETAGAEFLEVKGPYAILRLVEPSTGVAARIGETDGVRTHPVGVNAVTGELGVLTGTVVVKVRDPAAAAALAAAHGLRLDYLAGDIRCAFLVAPDGRDVVSAAAALARDPRVELASPEVIEQFPVPN